MCRYANKGVLVVDTEQKLDVLKKVLSEKPKEIKVGKRMPSKFRPEFWAK